PWEVACRNKVNGPARVDLRNGRGAVLYTRSGKSTIEERYGFRIRCSDQISTQNNRPIARVSDFEDLLHLYHTILRSTAGIQMGIGKVDPCIPYLYLQHSQNSFFSLGYLGKTKCLRVLDRKLAQNGQPVFTTIVIYSTKEMVVHPQFIR